MLMLQIQICVTINSLKAYEATRDMLPLILPKFKRHCMVQQNQVMECPNKSLIGDA